MPTCPNCSHTFEVAPPRPRENYETFLGLANSVLVHVRAQPNCRDVILSADDPMARQIGFETVNRTRRWVINLTRIHSEGHSERFDIYRTHLGTTAGRARIASLWSEGLEPNAPYVDTPIERRVPS